MQTENIALVEQGTTSEQSCGTSLCQLSQPAFVLSLH